jgi:predicted RNA-binding protein with PUA-like domain
VYAIIKPATTFALCNRAISHCISNIGKEIVGIAEIAREAYQDPTSENPNWLCVDVRPKQVFTRPVTLISIKAEPRLIQMALLRQSRLSVAQLTEDEFNLLCAMGLEESMED